MRIRHAREWGWIFLFLLVLMGCSREELGDKVAQPEASPLVKAPGDLVEKRVLLQFQAIPMIKKENPLIKKYELADLTKKKGKITFFRGSRYSRKVALTFDDGPDRQYTLQILEILKREKVPATFFVVGTMAKKNPDVLKMIDQSGDVIGNHTYSHPELTRIDVKAVNQQVDETNTIIKQIIGKEPLLFRPPYGAINKQEEQMIGQKGFKIILWSVDTRDWAHRTPQQIFDEVKKDTKPGAIILQHCAGNSGLRATVEALPHIIEYLRNEGYQFVTVDQLLMIPAYKR